MLQKVEKMPLREHRGEDTRPIDANHLLLETPLLITIVTAEIVFIPKICRWPILAELRGRVYGRHPQGADSRMATAEVWGNRRCRAEVVSRSSCWR